MKKVNFITALSPKKQYAIARWFWFSLALCVSSVVVGIYFVMPQLLTYISLKREVTALREKTKNYGETAKNRDALKTEHEVLRTRGIKVDTYNERPKSPHEYSAAIMQASGNGVTLERICFDKKDCECTILCPTTEHATVFIKRLSATDKFSGIKLISLQHDAQTKQFRSVIKAQVAS